MQKWDWSKGEEEIERNAKANGTWMKAPNGQPTNLNEKQWAQVRTKAFKKWFGDWELANLYNRALTAWNDKNSKGKVVMGLSERAKNRFGELLGTNVKQLVITDDAIRHIKKKHGEREELRGQKNMTPEDVVVIPYLINNFDSMELDPQFDDNKGNRAVTIRKRINGVSVIATIERGENKEFLVTSYQYVRSDALDVSNETPGLNVRNDSDIANVQKEIEEIKSSALNSSKVVDANGEPLVVYHGTTRDNEIKRWNEALKYYDTTHEPFYVFKRKVDGERNNGFFFNSNQQNAYDYGYNTYDTFLNIKNPLVIDAQGASYATIEYNNEIKDTYEWSEYAEGNGFDGVIFNNIRDGVDYNAMNVPTTDYVAFRPNQIKSATENNGDFSGENNDIRFRVANRNQMGFVSNAMKAVEGIKQEKATPQQWLAMIEKQGGLKAGEDKWLGLSDWLKSSDKKTLTKDEVLDFIGENMIRIEEVKYGEGMPKHAQEKLDELNAEFNEQIYLGEEETDSIYTSDWVDYAWSAMVDRYGDDFESAFRIEGGGTNAELVPMLEYDDEMTDQAKYFLEINDSTNKSINSTRLDYTTEGLENKREIALTVPTIESWNEYDDIHFGDAGDGRAVAWIRFGEATTYENVDDVQQVTDFHEPYKDVNGLDIYKPIGSFRNGDFIAHGKGRNGDMIYVVYINGNQVPVSYKTLDDARVGMNEYYKEHPRKLRKPLRVLVIDEIQSKRHQEGREKGYKNVYGDQLREINKQLVDVEAKISIGDATPEVIARRESLLDERRSILASVNPEANKIEDEIRAKESRSKELLREMGQNEENELVEVEKLRILQDGVRRVDEYDNLENEI
ncbi:MAG: hypothetical protein IIX35_04670, partial [Paraprevotella sp.]|nr:hypothetical protein [Paraprevotella sp.]